MEFLDNIARDGIVVRGQQFIRRGSAMFIVIIATLFLAMSLGYSQAAIPMDTNADADYFDAAYDKYDNCLCDDCCHAQAVKEFSDEFTALFNSYETKWSKNNRLMIRQGNAGSFKFVAKG